MVAALNRFLWANNFTLSKCGYGSKFIAGNVSPAAMYHMSHAIYTKEKITKCCNSEYFAISALSFNCNYAKYFLIKAANKHEGHALPLATLLIFETRMALRQNVFNSIQRIVFGM